MIGTTKAARPRAPYWELMAAILTLVVLVAGAWLWQAPQTVSAGNLAQELEQWNAGTSVSELLDAGYVEVTDVHDGQDATIEHFLEETSAGRQSVLRVFSRQDGDL